MPAKKPLALYSGKLRQLADGDFLDPTWNGILPTLRRELWTEQIVTADGFRWGRLGGSIEGYEDDYATVMQMYPGIVVAGNPTDLIYVPMTALDAPVPQVVTYSSVSSPSQNGGWMAFDNNSATSWRSAGGNYTSDPGGAVGDQYLQIDLGITAACGALELVPEDAAHAPKDFTLYGSMTNPANDADWYAAATPLAQIVGATSLGIVEISNGTEFQYYRLRITRLQAVASTGVYVTDVKLYARELALKNTEDSVGSALYIRLDGGGPGNHPWQDGKSAYELAVENGFQGTLAEWMDSLVGPEGPEGPPPDKRIAYSDGSWEMWVTDENDPDVPPGHYRFIPGTLSPDGQPYVCFQGRYDPDSAGGEQRYHTLSVNQMGGADFDLSGVYGNHSGISLIVGGDYSGDTNAAPRLYYGGRNPYIEDISPQNELATMGDISSLMASIASLSIPAGTVVHFAGNTPPVGYLAANGAIVSRTAYANLFNAIGTTFGAGDGSTTFALPDLRGEFIRGWDAGRGVDAGRAFGSAQGDAIRNILGQLNFEIGQSVRLAPSNIAGALYTDGSRTAHHSISGPGYVTDDTYYHGEIRFNASRIVPTSTENRPRNVALLPCIKY
jgi:hypothetical protein